MYLHKSNVKQILNTLEWVICYEYTNRLASIYTDLFSRWSDARGGDSYLAARHRAYSRYQWYFFKLAKTQACRDVADTVYTGFGHIARAVQAGKTAT